MLIRHVEHKNIFPSPARNLRPTLSQKKRANRIFWIGTGLLVDVGIIQTLEALKIIQSAGMYFC